MPATHSQQNEGCQAAKQDAILCNQTSTRLYKKHYEEWKLLHCLICADIGATGKMMFSCAICNNFCEFSRDKMWSYKAKRCRLPDAMSMKKPSAVEDLSSQLQWLKLEEKCGSLYERKHCTSALEATWASLSQWLKGGENPKKKKKNENEGNGTGARQEWH